MLIAIVMAVSPAYASWVSKSASDTHEGVTLSVNYSRDSDGVGMKLETVQISGCDDGCISVHGNYLNCWNQNNVIKWIKEGSDLNLGHSDSHLWSPNQTWSEATQLHCVYDGKKIDAIDFNGPDPFHDQVDKS